MDLLRRKRNEIINLLRNWQRRVNMPGFEVDFGTKDVHSKLTELFDIDLTLGVELDYEKLKTDEIDSIGRDILKKLQNKTKGTVNDQNAKLQIAPVPAKCDQQNGGRSGEPFNLTEAQYKECTDSQSILLERIKRSDKRLRTNQSVNTRELYKTMNSILALNAVMQPGRVIQDQLRINESIDLMDDLLGRLPPNEKDSKWIQSKQPNLNKHIQLSGVQEIPQVSIYSK